MTVDELIAAARRRLDDWTGSPLYATDELIGYLAEAEVEAAMRADLLYDDSSPFLTHPLAVSDRYTLDDRVWRIDRAWLVLTGQTRQIQLALTGIDQLRPGGSIAPRSGRPQAAAHVGKALRLWPIPTVEVTGVLKLAVYRLPLDPLEDGSDEPEIAERYHMGLIDWVLYRAYSNKDSEIEDPRRASLALSDFTERFGARPDAATHRRHNERRRTTTAYGGF